MYYDKLAECPEFTVVNEYVPDFEIAEGAYESESQLEQRFILTLESQGYEYLKSLTQEADLVDNLRTQMERLNSTALKGGRFTDKEWKRFYAEVLANPKDGIVDKTRKFQEERRFDFEFDDGHHDNLMIVDAEHLESNSLQVINQYEEHGGKHEVRYDVTVLMNGLPVVHLELKRRGVAIREAFNQIKRYNREGFWAGAALFEWVQIFIISNGTQTKYYANTTRDNHLKEMASAATKGGKKTSNSFEFTSWWADAKNKPITDIRDFAKTFFAQRTLRSILLKYCVFTEEELLLVMRPYQIAATERILDRVRYASNKPKMLGTVDAGGYVWHSTGSGKTLTSFKTAQLATKLDYVDRVLFVVDRQDLDNQTQKEYNKFQKDCVKGTVDTAALTEQLSDAITLNRKGKPVRKSKIVITTIQKLAIFVGNNPPGSTHAGIYQKHVVIIFDECHRSQFGKMHKDIDASPALRPKRELIDAFINAYNADGGQPDWTTFVAEKLDKDVESLAGQYGMDTEKTRTYLTNALAIGSLATTGEDFNAILPPMSLFADEGAAADYAAKSAAIAEALQALFDEYKGVYVEQP